MSSEASKCAATKLDGQEFTRECLNSTYDAQLHTIIIEKRSCGSRSKMNAGCSISLRSDCRRFQSLAAMNIVRLSRDWLLTHTLAQSRFAISNAAAKPTGLEHRWARGRPRHFVLAEFEIAKARRIIAHVAFDGELSTDNVALLLPGAPFQG